MDKKELKESGKVIKKKLDNGEFKAFGG